MVGPGGVRHVCSSPEDETWLQTDVMAISDPPASFQLDLEDWDSREIDATLMAQLLFECELMVHGTFLELDDTNTADWGSLRRSRSVGSLPAPGSLPIHHRCELHHSSVICTSRKIIEERDIETASIHSGIETVSTSCGDEVASTHGGSEANFADFVEWTDVTAEVLSARSCSSRNHSSMACGARSRTNLYVTSLPKSAKDKDLLSTFSRFGRIKSAVVERDGRGNSKCSGLVVFHDTDAALAAMAKCEQGRLTITDDAKKQWQLHATWAEVSGQKQTCDKTTRRRKRERGVAPLCGGTEKATSRHNVPKQMPARPECQRLVPPSSDLAMFHKNVRWASVL